MFLILVTLILLIPEQSIAQIADASFFPSVKSINPGIAHLRTHGFVALDVSKRKVDRNHDVPLGGIVGGIQTDVDLTKATLFRAGKGKGITTEFLLDQEKGEKVEDINSTTNGRRIIKNNAKSTYYGGILDLHYFGISYAGAKYDYDYKFRIGAPPSISAKDISTTLNYTNIKVGTAFKLGRISFGAYGLSQKAKGNYTYAFIDPSTGITGTVEKYPTSTSAKGYGIGLGFTSNRLRLETSLEKMYDNTLKLSKDYPQEVKKADDSSRLSFIGEARFRLFAIGGRVRSYKGNFSDLEDIISSNLLYGEMDSSDTRLETTFNFSLGIQKGFTYSAFYTQSKNTTNEKSPVFNNDLKYKAITKSSAYGLNLSYIY